MLLIPSFVCTINPWALMHSSTMLTECGIFVSIRQRSYRVFLRAQVQIKHASQAFLFLGPLRPLLTELHCSSCSTLTTPLLWAPPLYSSLAKHTEQEQKIKIPSPHCRLCFAVQRTDVLCPLCWHSSSHPSPTLHFWLSRTTCSPFMGPEELSAVQPKAARPSNTYKPWALSGFSPPMLIKLKIQLQTLIRERSMKTKHRTRKNLSSCRNTISQITNKIILKIFRRLFI